MKRIIALLFVLALAIPMYAQVANGSLPKGVMTYNSWSGKISVGGETIPKELLPHYFDEADMKEFKASHKRNVVIGKYNANLAYQPQLHFGDTPNGLGLALLF